MKYILTLILIAILLTVATPVQALGCNRPNEHYKCRPPVPATHEWNANRNEVALTPCVNAPQLYAYYFYAYEDWVLNQNTTTPDPRTWPEVKADIYQDYLSDFYGHAQETDCIGVPEEDFQYP